MTKRRKGGRKKARKAKVDQKAARRLERRVTKAALADLSRGIERTTKSLLRAVGSEDELRPMLMRNKPLPPASKGATGTRIDHFN